MAAYIFKLQVTNLSFDRRTFCTSLSSVEIHFQLNRYFTTFIVFSTSRLFIYLCTTFIKRIIHNLICSDALCMRNNVQGTFYIMFCKFMQFNKNFKTIFEYIRKKFRFVHTHTFCEYRKKLRASPRVHLVLFACVWCTCMFIIVINLRFGGHTFLPHTIVTTFHVFCSKCILLCRYTCPRCLR